MGTRFQSKQRWYLSVVLVTLLAVAVLTSGIIPGSSVNAISSTYESGIEVMIIVLFFIALLINITVSSYLIWEFNFVEKGRSDRGVLSKHIDSLSKISQGGGLIEQDSLLLVIENRFMRPEQWVQLISGLMITLGLVGTLLGLTQTIEGLSTSLSSLGEGQAQQFSNEVESILSGMSLVFSTTLLGSILGGLLLRVLHKATVDMIDEFVDAIRWEAEVSYIPGLQRASNGSQIYEISRSINEIRRLQSELRNLALNLNDLSSTVRNDAEMWRRYGGFLSVRNPIHILLSIMIALLGLLILVILIKG